VFAAESSWGKSSWLIAVADENLRRGKRVLIVTSEDDEETYGSRLLARRSRIAAKRIRSGEYEAGESELVDQVVAGAENLPVYLDARGKHCEWVAQQVDAIIERENIDLVAFDYLQEFSAARQQENHRLTVKYIAGTLRRVVKLQKRASIIMSQVTVDTNSKNEFPSRHMIRDCRDVANAAEVILIGYEVSKAIMDGTDENAPVLVPVGGRAIFVDKVKDGPKGFAVAVNWHEETASFDPYLRPRTPGTAEEQEALDPSWKTRPRRETLEHDIDDGRYGA
jgi:replicative DNA helicase